MNVGNHSSDLALQEQVLAALDFDRLDRAAIGVTVSHGIVTLQGCAPTREDIWLAGRLTQAIQGVRGVANDLRLPIPPGAEPSDSEIAEAAVNAIAWYQAADTDGIQVVVSDGHVTLTGTVSDIQQRGAAERAVRLLRGVRRVSNALTVSHSDNVTALWH